MHSLLRHKSRPNRDVAQLVAHYVRDVGVGRSSRLIPTEKSNGLYLLLFFYALMVRSALGQYTPKLKRDRQNQVVSYIICKGWTKYKASELGRGRKLMVKNIENTWKALHQEVQKIVAPSLKENQEVFADKPISATFSHKSCQSGSVNHYTEWQPESSSVNI